ncbi:MAG: DNA gyrase inhibitor YacG [Methylobacter sp.]|nr:DNA gyrase inhibitor YacG [Methylobacter sp.]
MPQSNHSLIVKCPNCGSSVAWIPEQISKPFCSERCKLIDLGEWAMEEKKIPGESIDIDTEEDHFFH